MIMKYYDAGHMMYTHKPSMQKFKKDVDEFIDQTSN
ncbi:MAG: carboxypeptidase C (cathepsin A) [Marivirga sp.]